MPLLENVFFVSAAVALQLVMVLSIWGLAASARPVMTDGKAPSRLAFPMLLFAWLALTLSLFTRALITGHVPFTDMYEFAASFAWGILLAAVIFRLRLKNDIVSGAGAVLALALLVYAFTLPAGYAPLSPVLRQTWLLPAHVSCAIIAYGMFGLAFLLAVLYLLRRKYAAAPLPAPGQLEKAAFESVVTGFIFLTLVLVIGSIWANMAWGSYWSWDPKETAALVTWLIYGFYILGRQALNWRDDRCAWFLVAGFLAVLLTFFGNYFFGGLHSYAWVVELYGV
jgi:cytochrome c-type biogenesis protein CcsB